jgi:hypothetical protein
MTQYYAVDSAFPDVPLLVFYTEAELVAATAQIEANYTITEDVTTQTQDL